VPAVAFDRPPRPLRLDGQPLTAIGRLRVYVCGITPYDVTHLGHAATYLWTDTAVRVIQAQGTAVTLTRNVTDIDDVLLAEAVRREQPYEWLAAMQRFSFERTMDALRVRRPDFEPTARAAVGQVVQLGAALLERGGAYERNGTVYARTAAAAGIAGLDHHDAVTLATEFHDRPDDPDKDDPLDVAVWQAATPGEVSWPGPWGPGRPGWHAECAAMVLAAYGAGVDLHCGGADLRFPHHACEALMAEQATGVSPFARAWLRAGTVHRDGAKMAKSTGNLVLVDDLLAEHSPAAVRLLCVNRPWSQPWNYTPELLDGAEARLTELYASAGRPGSDSGIDAVNAALLDNLNVPAALATALEAGGPAARYLAETLQLN
jgi:cysteinyl-tRNA synthetase